MKPIDLSLPAGCTFRKGTFSDRFSIPLLVLSAKLDPTQLRWEQFWVIEYKEKLIACGQLRNFAGAQELGSLVVLPAWRKKGLGTFLTQHLIEEAREPLYLECLGRQLAEFYSRLGFVEITFEKLPTSLKSKFRLSNLGRKLLGIPVVYMELLVISHLY
jgi:amino-acid N-acetyltransferase